MKRRALLTGGAAGVLAGCSGESAQTGEMSAPAVTRQRVELNLVTTWPKNLPGLGQAPERVAQYAEEMSGGTLRIKVFADGELVPAFEVFDAVSSGSADMYHGAEYYWQGKSKAFAFFTTVPMGLNAVEFAAWVRYGGGQELWDQLSGEFGIKPFLCTNSGGQSGGWFRNEVNTLDDFRGLKIRMPGLGGEVLRQLGAAPVVLPGSEIYAALQSRAIDATEWVGPWNDRALGFHQEAKYYYNPGFHEPGAALALGVNRAKWDTLSSEHQAIIRHACASVTEHGLCEFAYRNAEALRVLEQEHDVQVRSFSDEIWDRIAEASEQVIADVGTADDISRAVYDSYIAARKTLSRWTRVSETAFLRQRDRLVTGG